MKPELVFFSQHAIGGVQSYIYNLLLQDKEDWFEKRWILVDDYFNNNPRPQVPFDTGFEQVFHYRSDVPLFQTLSKLHKLISHNPGMMLASFPLELAALHVYRRENKTIAFICHDEYFLQFAKKYDFLIDVYIAHNPYFVTALKEILPHRKKDIFYLPYGIKLSDRVNVANHSNSLRLLVIARMQKSKGVFDIPILVEELISRGVDFSITMVGDGPEREELQKKMTHFPTVKFIQPPTPDALTEVIQQHDIFILPSYLDGMPVSLMETMTSGLVPVLTDFNPGIKEIVTPDLGFIFPKGDMKAFANCIEQLASDRTLLVEMRERVLSFAREAFNGSIRASEYYDFFKKFMLLKKPPRYKFISYGKLIDHPAVPRFIHKNYYRGIQLWNLMKGK